MHNISRMALLFWFRKSKKDPGKGTIQIRITLDASREEVGSTHITCTRETWDPVTQRLMGKGSWHAEQNARLKKLVDQFERLEIDLEREGYEINSALLKNWFLRKRLPDAAGITGVTHQRRLHTFSELTNLHAIYQRRRVSLGKLAQATVAIQANYAANISDCLIETKKDKLPATAIRAGWMEDLEDYLVHKEGFGGAHIEKHLKYVKQVLKWAAGVDRGLLRQNPLADHSVEGYNERPDTTYLTIAELGRLIDFDFYSLVRQGRMADITAATLSREHDAFCFNCFTGMHHGDYTAGNYRIEREGVDYFLIGKRGKTGQEFTLKLLAPALLIYQRYGSDLASLPRKSNQKRNDSLKFIALYVDLPHNLSTKIGRKTFADLALNEMFIPDYDVATMLGLSSAKYLKHYVRPRRKRLSALMVDWDQLTTV